MYYYFGQILERVLEEGRKAERKKGKWRLETEINKNSEQPRRVQVIISSIFDLAKKTRRIADSSRTCSNREDKENKYSSGQEPSIQTRRNERRNEKESIYNKYEYVQKEELLQLWRFLLYSKLLQKLENCETRKEN